LVKALKHVAVLFFYLVFLLLVLHVNAFGQGQKQTATYIAKTSETFKFADLQLLEAKLEAGARVKTYQCHRMVLDSATGSALYQFDCNEPIDNYHNNGLSNICPQEVPPCLGRCDWVAEILAQGTTAKDMLQSMDTRKGISIPNCTS
jgi:hypothetical protein